MFIVPFLVGGRLRRADSTADVAAVSG